MQQERLIIADLHLSTPSLNTLGLLDAFIARAQTAVAVYILGDLFDYWIGDDQPLPRELQQRFEQLSAIPGQVFFMPGNRDFLAGEALMETLGAHYLKAPYPVVFNQRSVVLTHGDELCTDDVAYMRMRTQLRSPAFIDEFLSKSLDDRRAIAEALRSQSKVDSAEKPEDIMDVNDQAVADLLAEQQADILVHGHTHRPAIHNLGNNQARVVVGDWHDTGWLVSVQQGELRLEEFDSAHAEVKGRVYL